jgi:excisionase family DNA binding protein
VKQQMTFGVDEVAEMLGLHPNTVYRAVKEQRLRAVPIGRRVLIPCSAIAELLAEPSQEQEES